MNSKVLQKYQKISVVSLAFISFLLGACSALSASNAKEPHELPAKNETLIDNGVVSQEIPMSLNKACFLKPQSGRCRAAFPRYYFDLSSGQCQQFIWGGCGGVVPFLSIEECQAQCLVNPSFNRQEIEQLNTSYAKWLSIEKDYEAYQYSLNFSSWVGFGHRTTITVVGGIPRERAFVAWGKNGLPQEFWTEHFRHGMGPARSMFYAHHQRVAKIQTMKQLYAECRERLLSHSPNQYQIILNFDDKGLLAQCLSSDKQCADDCSEGISLSSFELMGKKN